MKKIFAIAATIAIAFTGSANALTLKKGEVLSSGGEVVSAAETKTGRHALERDGYRVAGGMLFVKVNDIVVDVDMSDLRGKSSDQIRDLLRVEIGKELGVDFVVGDVTEQDVIDGVLDETIGSDTALFDATEAALEAYDQKVQEFINDPNGINADAIADGHEILGGGPGGEVHAHDHNG